MITAPALTHQHKARPPLAWAPPAYEGGTNGQQRAEYLARAIVAHDLGPSAITTDSFQPHPGRTLADQPLADLAPQAKVGYWLAILPLEGDTQVLGRPLKHWQAIHSRFERCATPTNIAAISGAADSPEDHILAGENASHSPKSGMPYAGQ